MNENTKSDQNCFKIMKNKSESISITNDINTKINGNQPLRKMNMKTIEVDLNNLDIKK